MKLATVRLPGRAGAPTTAVRVEDDHIVDLGFGTVDDLLAQADWTTVARSVGGEQLPLAGTDVAPVVTRPGKVVCVGLNYHNHIVEMGRELPRYPALFAKFAECLVGARDPIVKPAETDELDWEAELAVIIGSTVRRARGGDAEAAIAGFAVLNDVTCRDWQFRSPQWLQGKAWEATSPLGPYLVTPDELPGGVRPECVIRTVVDGETMQENITSELVFDPVQLVEYISTIVTLGPGDVIATGTPGGVGHARRPPCYLVPGQELSTEIVGVGRCDNDIVAGTTG